MSIDHFFPCWKLFLVKICNLLNLISGLPDAWFGRVGLLTYYGKQLPLEAGHDQWNSRWQMRWLPQTLQDIEFNLFTGKLSTAGTWHGEFFSDQQHWHFIFTSIQLALGLQYPLSNNRSCLTWPFKSSSQSGWLFTHYLIWALNVAVSRLTKFRRCHLCDL